MHVLSTIQVLFLSSIHRYLADLMDNSELIRNVALAGHSHTGKVQRKLTVSPVH